MVHFYLQFRALDTTPYAIQAPNYKDQPDQQPYIQQTETDSTEHPAGVPTMCFTHFVT